MSQHLRPVSDVSTDGWYTSTGIYKYACIDEAVVDDADYVIEMAQNDKYIECAFGTPSSTPSSGGGTFRFRAKLTGSATINLTPSIRMDSTLIKVGSAINPTTDFATYEVALSESDMAKITSWSNVKFRLLETFDGSPSAYTYVSWVEFEVPDGTATNKSGLEAGCLF